MAILNVHSNAFWYMYIPRYRTVSVDINTVLTINTILPSSITFPVLKFYLNDTHELFMLNIKSVKFIHVVAL